jgi:hypothetical protein
VWYKGYHWMKTVRMILLATLWIFAPAFCANPASGKIVWWGLDFLNYSSPPEQTNGVIVWAGDILSNVVAIAGGNGTGLALKSDGSVLKFGHNERAVLELAVGLTNVLSVTVAGDSCWAINRDGTVIRWGEDEDPDNVVAGLSNVTAITAAPDGTYLALKKDSSVTVLRLGRTSADPTGKVSRRRHVEPLQVGGQILSNVVSVASTRNSIFFLMRDGTVAISQEFAQIDPATGLPLTAPVQPSVELLKLRGRTVSNIVALAAGGSCALALKQDGTLISRSWGTTIDPSTGLGEPEHESVELLTVGGQVVSNATAIATDRPGLALKSDGTVVAWGGVETAMPSGLSSVIAIAQAGNFSLALVNGNLPPSVDSEPHGRLEQMEREADLIFKGQVLSTRAVSNSFFPDWANTHVAQFKLISVLKGQVGTNAPVLWHITRRPGAWGGGAIPSWYEMKPGQTYLVHAAKLDKPMYLFSIPPDATNRPNEFRQIYRDGVTRTLDASTLTTTSVKEAHWIELNLLLKDKNPTNQVYAINELDRLSLAARADDRWAHTDDFRRNAVLRAVLPLLTNRNEQVAVASIGCYAVGGCFLMLLPDSRWMPIVRGCSEVKPECIALVSPYSETLVSVANSSTSRLSRVAAIAALSCLRSTLVSNSLPRWLKDPADSVRAQALLVLPDFPGEFCERFLRERAADASPVVRAAVADAIGKGKIEALLPTLAALFSASPVQTNLDAGPHKDIQGDGIFADVGADDVHSSAGYALLGFDVKQVHAILRTNVTDKAFGLRFIRKLAPTGTEPYVALLSKELKAHTAGSEQEAAKNGFHWGLSYWLDGDYGWTWETLFSYVSAQTREVLAASQMAPILDALQIADDPGDPRTLSLYEFFLDKGMIERAIALRRGIIRRTEDKAIDRKSHNFPTLLKAFDEIDKKHSLKPGLGVMSPK